MTTERIEPPFAADETAMLTAWLDYHRATLLLKTEGLGHDRLRERSVPPSSLSLLGLVRHMAEVERWWFRRVGHETDIGDLFCSEEFKDGDFDLVADADAEADFVTFRRECDLADEAMTGRGLDDTFLTKRGNTMNYRWVYIHMIEEYARHNGHADLLRERIDGAVGQ